MLCGTALVRSELPLHLAESDALRPRRHERGGEAEFRFYWWAVEPVLPVWFEGRVRLVRWGNRSRRSRLPYTGCTREATVQAGLWGHCHPEPVRVLASFGVDKGTWFPVTDGIQGIVVRDERGEPAVYVVCRPATDYYRTMTRSDWMPVLLNQEI